jgi:hypothetical protein
MIGSYRTGADEDSFQIDVNDRIKFLYRHAAEDLAILIADQLGIAKDTGIIDQYVNSAPR